MPLPQPLQKVLRSLFRTPPPARRGDTPEGRRLISAGRVIATVFVTLVICALLDANSLVATVSQERYGTSRSVELSLVKPFRTVSQWTRLDMPHHWLNELHNSGQTSVSVPPEVAVPPVPSTSGQSGPPAPTSLPPGERNTVAPHPVVTTTLAPTTTTVPRRRVPTPQAPLKVWLAGDSLMGTISQAFEETNAPDPLISSSINYQVGTGLARPDVFSWPLAVAQEIATAKPDVVIMVFGANDDQDMMVDGKRIVLGTPAWEQEYAARVNQIATEVVTPLRTLIWLELPPTLRPQINTTDVAINQAVAATAALHPGMEVVSLAPPLTTPTGGYAEYLPSSSGQVQVRDTDGVHLTLDGGDRVEPLLLTAIRREWHLP